MRRLKILHVAHLKWYNAEVQYAVDLACEMRRRGHDVSFLGKTASLGVEKARARGLPTLEEEGFNAKHLASWKVLPAALRLYLLLRAERFDAVEVHRSEGLPLIGVACRAAGVPAVRVRGDMRPVRGDALNRLLYRRVLAGVVASNAAIAAGLRERMGAGLRVATIPGGVDPAEFSPDGGRAGLRQELGLEPEAFLVGLLGRMAPAVKGHADFLEAARRVLAKSPEAAFVLLVKGSLALPEALAARVASDPVLGARVRIIGHRPDLPAVLRDFDLGVVASTTSEANCRVGLEWMACGVPLVATTVGVLPDIVDHGRTGLLVAPGAPDRMAEAIAALVARREEARQMGLESRRRVLARFTLERCAAEHEAFVSSLRPGQVAGVGPGR